MRCLIGTDDTPGDRRGEALAKFGREIGLAFQLLDDVLDVAGPAERTGKARGTDLLDGTVTCRILAREHDPRWPSLTCAPSIPRAAEAACDRIAATGVLDQVRGNARERVERAKRALRTGHWTISAASSSSWSPTGSSSAIRKSAPWRVSFRARA